MSKSLAERIVDRIAAEGKFMVIDVAHVEHILDVADSLYIEDYESVPAAIELSEIEDYGPGVHAPPKLPELPPSADLADFAIEVDADKTPIANDVVEPAVEEPAAPAPKRRR